LIGPGVIKALPLTVLCMGLAALAAIGLPPFGLFYSELTVLSGGFAARQTAVSVLVLIALLMSFCGILKQLTRILLGAPKRERTILPERWHGVAAMALMLAALLTFSVWLPQPVLELVRQAAGIVGGADLQSSWPSPGGEESLVSSVGFSRLPEGCGGP